MSFDPELLIEATVGETAKDVTPVTLPFKKWDESSNYGHSVERFVTRLEVFSKQMSDGLITSDQGKALSAELRKENPELHREAMAVIGEKYGFAADDAEMERRAKLRKPKLQRAATKKPWKAKLLLGGNGDGNTHEA
jgi:hypothetical protein